MLNDTLFTYHCTPNDFLDPSQCLMVALIDGQRGVATAAASKSVTRLQLCTGSNAGGAGHGAMTGRWMQTGLNYQ